MSKQHQETCPACRFAFEADEAGKVCRTCALFRGCNMVRCPRCGYEWPREPHLLTWLRRHFGQLRRSSQ